MTYAERLKYLKLPSVKSRRLRNDLIETYKIFHQYNNVDFDDFFTMNLTGKTRNQEGKLHFNRFNTNLRKNCYSNRIVHNWNNLPQEIKLAPDLNTFKNILDTNENFMEQMYDFDE